MEAVVTKCQDCPFCHWDGFISHDCVHPARKDWETINRVNSIPDDCPLIKEPITIKLCQ